MSDHIETILQQRLGGGVRDLHITIEGRGLVLYGRASSTFVRGLAAQFARQLIGLPVRSNEIVVE